MGVCTSSGKGEQSLSRETTSSLMSSWNRLNQIVIISADDFHKRNSIGKELLKRAVDGSSNSAYYKDLGQGYNGYEVNLGTNNPSYRLGGNDVAIIPTSGEANARIKVKQFKNPAEAVKFVDSEIKRIKGNRK